MNDTPKFRWIAFGNVAHGFFAMGNVVSGVIAIGNVARGFIAFGNLAVGVIAVGNVGFGVLFGAGATVGVGLVSVSGVIALPVLLGAAAVADVSPWLAFLPPLLWGLASFVLKGTRPEPPGMPPLTTLEALLASPTGSDRQGWILARIDELTPDKLAIRTGGQRFEPRIAESLRPSLGTLSLGARDRALLRVRVVEQLQSIEQQGYRMQPSAHAVVFCEELVPVPKRPAFFTDSKHLQWALAGVWRVAAVVGIVLAIARLVFL